jgi:hypothetical protein
MLDMHTDMAAAPSRSRRWWRYRAARAVAAEAWLAITENNIGPSVSAAGGGARRQRHDDP